MHAESWLFSAARSACLQRACHSTSWLLYPPLNLRLKYRDRQSPHLTRTLRRDARRHQALVLLRVLESSAPQPRYKSASQDACRSSWRPVVQAEHRAQANSQRVQDTSQLPPARLATDRPLVHSPRLERKSQDGNVYSMRQMQARSTLKEKKEKPLRHLSAPLSPS